MLRSLDPYRLQVLATYENETSKEIQAKINAADQAFKTWRVSPLEKRSLLINKIAALMIDRKQQLAEIMAFEMGKPITQGLAEIDKCITVCRYYSDHIEELLADRKVETDALVSVVRKNPVGVWLGIMPWNFPFWQVFRCAIPAIAAGNTFLLKHASNVTGCALLLEQLMKDAGAKKGIFQVLQISSALVEDVIQHDAVRGISLTGSESAGRQVAANAGRQIKPVILELGGSNAFIVLPDADLNLAVEHAIIGRFQNNGQSCIAAKRFLVHADVFDRFVELFKEKIEALKVGDPLDPTTYISTLVNQDAAEAVQSQVNDAVRKGAKILCGGKYQNAVYYPTLMVDVTLDMRCMTEEVFGPVAPVMKITSLEEAMEISNNSRFGLGVSIFTQNRDAIVKKVDLFNEGAVFINSLVKSDTRLPFGGVKNSGYGRELSIEGIDEFMNRKTVFIS